MARARLDNCPMCGDLRWWRTGDTVRLLQSDDGKVIGLDCASCGGWRDDCERVGDTDLLEQLRTRR